MKRMLSLAVLSLPSLLASCGGLGDRTPPTVTLKAAPSTVVYPGDVILTAEAKDDQGIERVDFYQGDKLLGSDTTVPYTFRAPVTGANNGKVTFTAKAFDTAANTASVSTDVLVNIQNEPNDTVATATALSLGTPLNGVIGGIDRDTDHYKFTAAAGDALKLSVKSKSFDAASTLDPYVMILMPDGKTVLEKDDDSGAGLESEIRFNAPVSGTYFVVVTSFDIHDEPAAKDGNVTNTYQLLLSRR